MAIFDSLLDLWTPQDRQKVYGLKKCIYAQNGKCTKKLGKCDGQKRDCKKRSKR
jgi:hypothetical protein